MKEAFNATRRIEPYRCEPNPSPPPPPPPPSSKIRVSVSDLHLLLSLFLLPSSIKLQFPLRPPNSRISDLSMSALRPEPGRRMSRELSVDQADVDRFDWVPDSVLLLIFNWIGDVKTLGRCCVVSRRFHDLVPQVDNVVVKVDCVMSDDETSTSAGSSMDKSRGAFSSLFQSVFGGIVKPLQALGQLLGPRRGASGAGSAAVAVGSDEVEQVGVTRHSPSQVLKNFNEIRFLKIELPSGELGIDDGVLLKWRAEFGSTLDKCVILGASSIIYPDGNKEGADGAGVVSVGDDSGSIPESFYANGGLKLRVVWTISSLIAASARHYLLQPIIAEHRTLDSLVLTDADGQGVLCMNGDQLEELQVKPLSASSASKRTLVPALTMRLWYAMSLELPDGVVLMGATLVAILPSEQFPGNKDACDLSWVANTFDEPYRTAVKMLMKRRIYCLEMNSF